IPYPPVWGMAASPLALVSFPIARAVVYLVGPFALLLILALLDGLTRGHLPLKSESRFLATALALILSSRFIERDFIECGPNLALVALTWLGVALWIRRRELLGGVSLGLAIALKCTRPSSSFTLRGSGSGKWPASPWRPRWSSPSPRSFARGRRSMRGICGPGSETSI